MPVPPQSPPSLYAAPCPDAPRITKRRCVLAPNRTEFIMRMPTGDPIVQVVPIEHVAAFEAAAGIILAAIDDYGQGDAEHVPGLRLHA